MCVVLRKRQMVRTCIFSSIIKDKIFKNDSCIYFTSNDVRICAFITFVENKRIIPFLIEERARVPEQEQICAAGGGLMFDLFTHRVECNIWSPSLASSAAAEHRPLVERLNEKCLFILDHTILQTVNCSLLGDQKSRGISSSYIIYKTK